MWILELFTKGFSFFCLALLVIFFAGLCHLSRDLKRTSENLGKSMRDTVQSLTKHKED